MLFRDTYENQNTYFLPNIVFFPVSGQNPHGQNPYGQNPPPGQNLPSIFYILLTVIYFINSSQ